MKDKLLTILLLGSLITTCSEIDISVPSFPQIAQFFNVEEGMIQLTIAYNFLGFCIGALLYGPLSECYGRRRMMILGNGIMLAGALGCLYSHSIHILLLSRFIQGIGASTSVVLVFAIIADLYQGEKAFKLIGLMNACLSIVMAIAPLIGGFINESFGWRGNYSIVVLLGSISWIFLLLFLPETKTTLDKFSPRKIIIDYRNLLFSGKFMSAALVPSLLFSAYMSFIAASSFLYIETYGLPTLNFVAHQAIIVASFAMTSLIADKLIKRLSSNQVVMLGIGISTLGSLALIFLGWVAPLSAYFTTATMCLFCIGFAACYPVIFSESLSIFPHLRGSASSIIMSIRALLVFLFTGLISQFYNGETSIVAWIVFLGVASALLITTNMVLSRRFVKVNA